MLVYIYGHNTGAATGWLACWNSTLAINSYNQDPTVWNFQSAGDFPSITSQLTTPLDWEFGIMWNITVPLTSITGSSTSGAVTSAPGSWSIAGADAKYVILTTGKSSYNSTGTEYFTMAAIEVDNLPMTTTYTIDVGGDAQHVTKGAFSWIENVSVPAADQTYPGTAVLRSGGNIIYNDDSLLLVWDFSESTGTLLWTSTPFNNDFEFQDITGTCTAAYGILYYPGYDGYMHAINITTGVQQWDSITAPGGLEMPEPGYPASAAVIANNEVFTSTSKAYETQPAYRGHALYAYNAMTGVQNWNVSGEYTGITIADGILIAQNLYDGKEYAFSAGPTATTVSSTLWQDQKVDIQGTVTDQTPGIAQGTPAISDTWMTPWMQYLYMEQPYPTQATGVNVVITAIDPNHNLITIGNATSDISGYYHYTWTPPNVPGTYTIIATFNSDNSYSGSCAETSAVVVSPAAATPAPTATPTSVADMYFVPAIAGLFILIIVVAIVLALLMIRKRP
jgi:hypothetical protein